jgi:hypothetical protein
MIDSAREYPSRCPSCCGVSTGEEPSSTSNGESSVLTLKETFKDLVEATDARMPFGTLPPPVPIVERRRKSPVWVVNR